MKRFKLNPKPHEIYEMERGLRAIRATEPKNLSRSDFFVKACKKLQGWSHQWGSITDSCMFALKHGDLTIEPARIREVLFRDFGDNIVLLRSLYIKPEQRGKDYGFAVMKQLTSLAEERKVPILLIVRPFEYRESRKKKMLCDLTENDLRYCTSDEKIHQTKKFFTKCAFREIINIDWDINEKSVVMIYVPKRVDIMVEAWIEKLEFAN